MNFVYITQELIFCYKIVIIFCKFRRWLIKKLKKFATSVSSTSHETKDGLSRSYRTQNKLGKDENRKKVSCIISGGSRISPRRGRQLPGGAPTYDFVNFCRKLHENEDILAARGGRASPAPPLRSATDYYCHHLPNLSSLNSIFYFWTLWALLYVLTVGGAVFHGHARRFRIKFRFSWGNSGKLYFIFEIFLYEEDLHHHYNLHLFLIKYRYQ